MKSMSLAALVASAVAITASAAPFHEPSALHREGIADHVGHATTVTRRDLGPGEFRPALPLASAQLEVRLPTVIHTGTREPELTPARPVGAR